MTRFHAILHHGYYPEGRSPEVKMNKEGFLVQDLLTFDIEGVTIDIGIKTDGGKIFPWANIIFCEEIKGEKH